MAKIESITVALVEEGYTVTVKKLADSEEKQQIYVSYGGRSLQTAIDVARCMALSIGNH